MRVILPVERRISAYAGGFMERGMKAFFCSLAVKKTCRVAVVLTLNACEATFQVRNTSFSRKSDELRQRM